MIRRRKAPWFAVLGVVGILAAACSLSNEKQPRALDTNELPPELQTPTTAVPTSLPTGKPQSPIYVFDGKHLHELLVAVDSRTPDAVLNALISAQVKDPLTTDIPLGLTIGKTKTTTLGGCKTLRIPVSKEFSTTLQGDQQRIAVAQLVYTATQFPDIDCVAFRIQGQNSDAEVPTGAKSGTATVVSRNDYRDIAPTGTTS